MVACVCQVLPVEPRSGIELGQAKELLERIAGGKPVAGVVGQGMTLADKLDIVASGGARRLDQRLIAGLQGVAGVQAAGELRAGAGLRCVHPLIRFTGYHLPGRSRVACVYAVTIDLPDVRSWTGLPTNAQRLRQP
jgi:hypothetical protein